MKLKKTTLSVTGGEKLSLNLSGNTELLRLNWQLNPCYSGDGTRGSSYINKYKPLLLSNENLLVWNQNTIV